MSENLLKLASQLREKAAELEKTSMLRAGQTIKAAMALNVIREKVNAHVR